MHCIIFMLKKYQCVFLDFYRPKQTWSRRQISLGSQHLNCISDEVVGFLSAWLLAIVSVSGYAYHLLKGQVYHINDVNIDQAWTGSSEVGLQAPTTVLMKPDKTFHSFGFEAESKYKSLSIQGHQRDWYYFRFFKMKLHHERVSFAVTK